MASRRRLGSELRSLREKAGKRIEDAALALECSSAKISRLENGKGVPRTRDVRDLAALYGSGAHAKLGELLELALEGQGQDWWSDFRDVTQGEMFADHLLRYVALERDASTIKSFAADIVPGLLQADEYIDAVCALVFPEHSQKDRARFVEFRQKRQEIVWGAAQRPEVSFIVSEASLIRPIGGPAVMRRQLEALHAGLEKKFRDVDFRVTPLSVPAPGALGGPFAIIKFADGTDQDVVYLEGREGAAYLESDGDVKRYEEKFSSLERDSLSRAQSLERLIQEIESLDARSAKAMAAAAH